MPAPEGEYCANIASKVMRLVKNAEEDNSAKDPGTTSKERPCHQELSFGARRRGSPSLGLGAPGFIFISKLLKESIYLTFVVGIVEKWQDQESILLGDHLLALRSRSRSVPGATITTHPVVERILNTRDARSLIELNQYKYTNVPVAEEHMANLTSDELAEAIRLYRQEQTRLQEEAELEEEPEESGDSQQSKRSVFDRIGAKGKKSKKDQCNKKEAEAAK
ncbi:hypothetical protein AgCh_008843 [Apium graveolens]